MTCLLVCFTARRTVLHPGENRRLTHRNDLCVVLRGAMVHVGDTYLSTLTTSKVTPEVLKTKFEQNVNDIFETLVQETEALKEKDDEEAGETAAAKDTEEVLKEDVEFQRLIEERRSTPKEEKQRLKEVSKCIKMYQKQKKNEKTARHPKNT